MVYRWFFIFCCLGFDSFAQNHIQKDSTKLLDEVVVKAFAYNRSLKETPVSLGLITEKDLNRFSPTSILSAVNTVPGVRMEERSPGSYRFSIRGSTIRSPFGVRNVKFYWNGLPLTDGGGSTYLNVLDFEAFGRVEIIKGPSASLYGAGTGGAVLLENPFAKQNQIQVSSMGGNFGLQRYQVSSSVGNEKRKLFVNYAHQQSDGYRQQTAMRKDAFNVESKFSLNQKNSLQVSLFYTDLYYQTPGGLTEAQYNADPRQARPATNTQPGAVQQQAAIYNKTIYLSTSLTKEWSARWSSQFGIYGSYSDFTNPSIFSYSRNTDRNWGARTTAQYEFQKSRWNGKWVTGAEYQYFYTPLINYKNLNGEKGAVQTDDRLYANSSLLFTQFDVVLPHNFFATMGLSGNFLNYQYNRLTGTPLGKQTRNFDPVLCPRFALTKKISGSLSVFSSISKGFSPPALAEVLPSVNVFNTGLQPEQGINYELGLRGLLPSSFTFDFVAYDFELAHPIVGLKNNFNQDFFVNASRNSQKGIETSLSWQRINPSSLINLFRAWLAFAYTNYKFVSYNYGNVNYSGNRLTGMPLNTLSTGFDFKVKNVYANVTSTYVDRIPLNDANTSYASDYLLIGSRIGYRNDFKTKTNWEFFAGVDNALDKKYSLGNDLNTAVGRYFNAAATRNYYLGIKIVPKLN